MLKNFFQYQNSRHKAFMSDIELWNALRQGQKSALERIYRDHAEVLLRYGRKFIADGQLVEDCIQDLFVDLWNKREGLGENDSVRRYLLVALRRRVFRVMEREVKKVATEEPEEKHFQADFSIDYQLIQEELSAEKSKLLQTALDGLSDRQREVIYLKFFAEMDYPEIGEVMGLNYQSARNLAYRALEALRDAMLVLFLQWWLNFLPLN
jgi:RNA polymerase sigma factor (sigma-70 family)